MTKGRLEAFSDGVIAILITIMVLELHRPEGHELADLKKVVPTLLVYLLSFVLVAIYWNNHHHLMQIVERVDGAVLWANMHLLFWLSLVPWATSWMGDNVRRAVPVGVYTAVLLGAAIAYFVLTRVLLRLHGPETRLARALGADWKGKLSALAYIVAVPLAALSTWATFGIVVSVAVVWLVPDRRVARVLASVPAEQVAAAE
jgi:uncharacterized membrane protein